MQKKLRPNSIIKYKEENHLIVDIINGVASMSKWEHEISPFLIRKLPISRDIFVNIEKLEDCEIVYLCDFMEFDDE